MKTKIILILTLVIAVMMAFGQRPAMELTFTAIDSAAWVQFDSIKVMNRTRGGDTVLVYPDTVLMLNYVGLPDSWDASEGFSIYSYPNPVADYATISIYIPVEDVVILSVTDIQGRQVIRHEQQLPKGTHTFSFTPGGESLYLVAAEWKGYSRTIKTVNLSKSTRKICSLSYSGFSGIIAQVKAMEAKQLFDYNPGDELLYVGYKETLESGILDSPETTETFTFQFASNITCPGMPTVTYEGQVYNTIQIFSQCWLNENLNVGTMIPGEQEMTDNGIIEKFCFNNEPDSCTKYGGLYQWWEMMQYTTVQGVQGICPPGWHLPKDEEWNVLEGAVDSQYGIRDQIWGDSGFRGFDAGTNLKTISGWYGTGNGTDLFGFSGLPAGGRYGNGCFDLNGGYGYWWTSTEFDDFFAWLRFLRYNFPGIYRSYYCKDFGLCVRCLRDN